MSYPVASTPNPSVHVTRPTGSTPMSPQQWEAYGTALVDEFLAQVLMAVASIDVVGTHPFAGLQQWATQLDQAAQNALVSAQGAQSTANGAYGDFQNYVSGNYTGITTPMAGLIPASRIVDTTPNLQVDPGFDTTAAIAGSADWTLDSTQGHTALGSAVTTANGTDRSLLGTIVPVQVGNVISLELWTKWATLACPASATPVQLQIEPDSGPPVLIAGIVGPAASSDWTQLTGTYTVPAGVAWVRLRLLVTGDATAGQVWVDDASIILSGGFLDALSSDTQNVIAALTNGGTSGQVSEAWNNLLGLFSLTPANMTAGALNAQTVWTNTINTVIADLNLLVTTGDYHPLLSVLFGSTATPTGSSTLNHAVMPGTFANLGAAFHQLVTDIANPFGNGWANVGADFAQIVADLTGTTPTLPTPNAVVVPQASIDQSTGWVTTASENATAAQSSANSIQAGLYGGTSTAPNAVAATVLAQAVPNLPATQINSATGTAGQTLSNDLAAISEPFQTGGLFDPTAWSDAMTGLGNLLGVHPTALPSTGSTAQIASAQVSSPVAGDANVGVTAQNAHAAAGVAQSDTQAVVDAINNSVTGGTGTNTPVSTVQANLQQIPQANVKINPNVGSQPPILFDSVGAGAAYGAFTSSTGEGLGATITWSHTVGANANAVIVLASLGGTVVADTMTWMVTATPSSGSPMYLLQLPDAATNTAFMVFGGNLTPGTYTISLNGNLATNGGAVQSVPGFAGTSISYQGVRLFGVDLTDATGSSSSPSLAVPAPTSNPLVIGLPCVCNVASTASAAALSAMTGATSRLSQSFTAGSSGIAFMVGDVEAAVQGSFGAAAASTSGNQWAAFEIMLQPSFTPTGSYAELARRSSAPVSMSKGTAQLPAGALDTVIALSPDLTAVSGNGIRVSLSGVYVVQAGVLFYPPVPSGVTMGVVVNGAATDAGTYQSVVSTAAYTGLVYLNVGDVVSVQLSVGAAWSFMGSGGNLTYLRVGLANRSLH